MPKSPMEDIEKSLHNTCLCLVNSTTTYDKLTFYFFFKSPFKALFLLDSITNLTIINNHHLSLSLHANSILTTNSYTYYYYYYLLYIIISIFSNLAKEDLKVGFGYDDMGLSSINFIMWLLCLFLIT